MIVSGHFPLLLPKITEEVTSDAINKIFKELPHGS
jgi:hypothetical protein